MAVASDEQLCARLCLLTRIAWDDSLPPPLTRPMLSRMLACGAVDGLALRECEAISPELAERARLLLSRSADVYACLNAYRSQGYEALLPGDALWPDRLRRLGANMPQFLFVLGRHELLSRRAAAVAGSREISKPAQEAARKIGAQLARERIAMVSGGARGVDSLAQKALLDEGGELLLVPALPVKQLLQKPELASALAQGRLLLVCDALPDSPFSAPKALARNHTIYALGEAAIVAAAREGVGGSWRGAQDCLRGGYSPVFVVDDPSQDMAGNRALMQIGAQRLELDRPLVQQLFAPTGAEQTRLFDAM